jgi:glyoxylase-like metal-dependent hydrolase (beta-lactamase superfamily II)
MAHVALMASGSDRLNRRLWARQPVGQVVAQEPWGSLERISDGIWALISTPLEDRTTLCNGGIVAGRDGVLVVESFGSPAGARWMAEQAERLTGSRPTHVVLTHYHGDHCGGISGFAGEGGTGPPALRLTETTRRLIRDSDSRREGGVSPLRIELLDGAEALDPDRVTSVDLGGRSVRVVPRDGHTASDVTIEVEDPSVVFCGDLVWNEMFPNYVDTLPSALSVSLRALLRDRSTVYVPGHGPLADDAALGRYLLVLDDVEAAARRAHGLGMSPAEAAEEYRLPQEVGEWLLFNPAYFERALAAWERELAAAGP